MTVPVAEILKALGRKCSCLKQTPSGPPVSPSVSLPNCLRSRVVTFSVLTLVTLPGKLVV